MMQRLRLADTLERIQKEPDTMYTGTLAHDVVDDIKDFGEHIQSPDLFSFGFKGSGETNTTVSSLTGLCQQIIVLTLNGHSLM